MYWPQELRLVRLEKLFRPPIQALNSPYFVSLRLNRTVPDGCTTVDSWIEPSQYLHNPQKHPTTLHVCYWWNTSAHLPLRTQRKKRISRRWKRFSIFQLFVSCLWLFQIILRLSINKNSQCVPICQNRGSNCLMVGCRVAIRATSSWLLPKELPMRNL